MREVEQYAPDFSVLINKTELRHGFSAEVLSVSVTDTVDRADSFSLTLQDRHPEPGRFAGGAQLKWMDSGLFDEGNPIKIRIGYVDDMPFEFWGSITAVSPSFPGSGLPTLSLRGFSLYQDLQHKRRRKPFKKVKDSDIVKEIATAMQLSAKVDDTQIEYPLVPAKDMTYAEILKQRAQRIGYEVVVKKDTLYFQEPRYLVTSSPDLTLEWGRDLRSFTPSISTYSMVTEVTVRATQTSRGLGKQPLVGTAKAGAERVILGEKSGSQIAEELFGKAPIVSQDHNAMSQEEANALALAQLENKSLGYITGKGSCIGNPHLTARGIIELKGLGARFSGTYYVTSTTHKIDASGYRTDFEVKRNGR